MKKSEIRKIIANMRIPIPKEVEKELLEVYGALQLTLKTVNTGTLSKTFVSN